ncbi:MAG: hypothetical protein HKN20_10910 [Gemmatimonadetes bacterium]|nr:hypothetical protein [Gemmatimonadota bacterium]
MKPWTIAKPWNVVLLLVVVLVIEIAVARFGARSLDEWEDVFENTHGAARVEALYVLLNRSPDWSITPAFTEELLASGDAALIDWTITSSYCYPNEDRAQRLYLNALPDSPGKTRGTILLETRMGQQRWLTWGEVRAFLDAADDESIH